MKKLMLVLLVCCGSMFAQNDVIVVATHAVAVLRDNVKDPTSLVIEHIYANTKADKTQMCIRYRARNSFGGYEREMMGYKGGTFRPDLADACFHIEGKWDWATKKGWTDITEEYQKAASAAPSNPE